MPEPARSRGRVAFHGPSEYSQLPCGDVHRAPAVDPVLPDGRRSGRFLCTPAAWPSYCRMVRLDPATARLPAVPPVHPGGPGRAGARFARLRVTHGSRTRAIRKGDILLASAETM